MDKETAVTLGKNNQIIEPNLHDAEIDSIQFGKNFVSFCFRLIDDRLCMLDFREDVCLKCDDIRQGNIVLDITVESGIEIDFDDLRELHDLPKTSDNVLQQDMFEKIKQHFIEKKYKLVSINPSYGCNALLTCKNIVFYYIDSDG